MVAVASFPSESRFRLLHAGVSGDDFAGDVRVGLTAERKWLAPRWFYDALGSALFDAICFLPEYYVMRAEAEVLTAHRDAIVAAFGSDIRLVELGSGAARKTRILLDALGGAAPASGADAFDGRSDRRSTDTLEYVPIDVDAEMLERSGRELLLDYPRLRVTAIRSDFSRPSIPLSKLAPHRGRTVVLFLGSTIGNLDPDAAVAMLSDLRGALAPGDALLLGADLKKDRSILEPAYDDPTGVTAAFNLNLLGRINRELGGTFDLASFRHRAFYDTVRGRIEMHLVSTRAQRVRIAAIGLDVAFAEGETIHTESSYKHDTATLTALAGAAGFSVGSQWSDAGKRFTDVLMVAS